MGSSVWHVVFLVCLLALLALSVMYLFALRKALQALDADCIGISPNLVWLLLVPVLNVVVFFVVVVALRKGYRRMSAAGRLRAPSSAGGGVGIALGVCLLLSRVPGIGPFLALASLLLWAGHWSEVNKARRSVISVWAGDGAPAGALRGPVAP